jgi:Acetoacetate decarboxylase (ADC)
MPSTYVDRSGELSWCPPYTAAGVNFFGFAIACQTDALRALCDRYLNGPLGEPGRFFPASAHALLVFNTIERLQSQTKPEWGWTSEQETAVWLLIADRKLSRLVWFHPYIWVDSDAAMVSGREVYGFPKALGWFDIPHGPAAPQQLSVDTMLVRHYGNDAKRERATLMRAHLHAASDVIHVLTDMSELFSTVTRRLRMDFSMFADPGIAADLTQALIRRDLPMLFLKQFRSGERPQDACFQRLQQVEAKLAKLHDARVYVDHEYEIDVLDADSHPLRRDLGLAPGAIRVDMSFWVAFDLEIGNCTLLGSPAP